MTWARRLVVPALVSLFSLVSSLPARSACPAYLTQWGGAGSAPGQFAAPGGMAVDAAGNLYACDVDNHRVQKFSPGGAFISQWGSLGAGSGQFNKPYGIAVDTTTGHLYVADGFNYRVQRFSASGSYIGEWGGLGTGNGQFVFPTGIAIDESGNVYVADHGLHRVQKFTSSGMYLGQWGSFGGGNGQFQNPVDLVVRGGFAYVVDGTNQRVQKFTDAGVYVSQWGQSGAGDGELSFPTGVAIDPDGDILIADQANHRIQRFSTDGVYLCQWGSFGTGDGQFDNAYRVTSDETGAVYVADIDNHRIQKFTEDCPGYCGKWGTPGAGPGEFAAPAGLALESGGDLLVCDISNHRIQRFTTSGAFVAQWGSFGTGDGQFRKPYDVAVDGAGDLYVADFDNNRIQKFDASGSFLGKWGSLGFGNGQFFRPAGVDVDDAGNVYVADFGNHRIQKFSSSGSYIAQWGSPGSGPGQFDNPIELIVTGGLAYVVDGLNHRVQVFTDAGAYIGSWGGFGTGPGEFSFPSGIAVAPDGNLLVTDQSNRRVQRFSSAGLFRCQFGSNGSGDGQFDNPYRVAVDGAGSVYVTDSNLNRVQRFGCSSIVSLAGVGNTALGGAQLQVVGDTVLVLSNIGTSGNDGVSFPASAPDEGRGIEFAGGVPIDHAIDQGGSMVAEMIGTAGGDTSSLGTITLDVVADGIDITPDFADLDATEVHVEAYLGAERVHSCRVPNGAPMHRSAASVAGGPGLAAAGDGIGGVDLGFKKKPGGQLVALSFTTSKTVNVGGTPVVANQLVFSTPTLKQPVAAATAVLKVKRPATLLASGTESVLAFSNLEQVAIRRQDAKPDVGGKPSGGIRMEPKGAASFAAGPLHDGATFVGIGASGQDGVDLILDSSRGATHVFGDRMGFDTSTDAGAELEHHIRGKLGCRPDSTVAIVKETAYPDSITLRPDFSRIGATGVRITILHGRQMVHQAVYPPAQTVRLVEPLTAGPRLLAASINTTRSNIKDKASIASSGVKSSWSYKPPGGGSGASLVTSHMGFDFMIGANRFQGDDVEFEAVGGASVAELTGASMKQKNPGGSKLDSLRMGRGEFPLKGPSADEMVASGSAKGDAKVTVKDDKMAFHDLGSGGADGAKMKLDRPAEQFETQFKAKEAAGSGAEKKIDVSASGKRSGGSEKEEVLRVGTEKTMDKHKIGPRPLGGLARGVGLERAMASSYRLEVLMGASVVATQDAAIPEAEFDDLPDRLRMVASGPAFEGYWDAPLLVSIVGGSSVMGDGIRIRPLGEPDDVESIEEIDIEAANFLSFELSGWEAFQVTSVDPSPASRPARLVLGRNPVLGAEALKLSVTVPSASWVDLDAFDAQGRRVATIFHGVQEPGTTARTWSPGRDMGSGIYFVRMRTRGVIQTEKAVFIR